VREKGEEKRAARASERWEGEADDIIGSRSPPLRAREAGQKKTRTPSVTPCDHRRRNPKNSWFRGFRSTPRREKRTPSSETDQTRRKKACSPNYFAASTTELNKEDFALGQLVVLAFGEKDRPRRSHVGKGVKKKRREESSILRATGKHKTFACNKGKRSLASAEEKGDREREDLLDRLSTLSEEETKWNS